MRSSATGSSDRTCERRVSIVAFSCGCGWPCRQPTRRSAATLQTDGELRHQHLHVACMRLSASICPHQTTDQQTTHAHLSVDGARQLGGLLRECVVGAQQTHDVIAEAVRDRHLCGATHSVATLGECAPDSLMASRSCGMVHVVRSTIGARQAARCWVCCGLPYAVHRHLREPPEAAVPCVCVRQPWHAQPVDGVEQALVDLHACRQRPLRRLAPKAGGCASR